MWDIPYDKLYAKYYLEGDAYRLLQEYFLDHTDYNYMVIAPDDLVLNKEGVDLLIKDIEQFEYPALAGICNFSYHDRTRYACGPSINGGPTSHSLESLKQEVAKNGPIIRVGMEAFSCLFIKREILEEHYPGLIKPMPISSFDWGFSHACHWKNIPIRVDTRAQFLHLANRAGKEGIVFENFFRGIKLPQMIFEPADGSMIVKVRQEDRVAVLPM